MTAEVRSALDRAREAYARQAWADAYGGLAEADGAASLGLDDLERLAVAAFLTGHDADSADLWVRATQECLRLGEAPRAVRCAFHIVFGAMDRGEMATAAGWLGRASHFLDDHEEECAERGLLMLPSAVGLLEAGELEEALAMFETAAELGARFGDTDLTALAGLGRGRSLVGLGSVTAGLAVLDETMVAVTSGEVSPITTGVIYCAVIEVCQQLFDLRRAQEWTNALGDWCAVQPELVPYRGQCMVHRAEILQLHGRWSEAADEAHRARDRLAGRPALGAALYREAELLRLRGRVDEALDRYLQASEFGQSPHPGLAQLRLAQGQIETAAAAIRREMAERRDAADRTLLLPAFVEISLAAGDVADAREAADELARVAGQLEAPVLHAAAAAATGAVLLAEGDAGGSLTSLRASWAAWQRLQAPHEAARVRVLLGLACRAVGDGDTGEIELEAAARAFRQLGAEPDLARVEALRGGGRPPAAGGLTRREVEVLRLVASGRTNRAVAGKLGISERTVARHVSNIFAKLDLPSRAAATAYAYEHGLVETA